MKLRLLTLTTAAWCSLPFAVPHAFAPGAPFTYQGRLEINGTPAEGSYDFTISLYTTSTGADENQATDKYGVVPGGLANYAEGVCSFAAGNTANADYDGSFVWSDNTGTGAVATGPNQLLARASGGFYFYTGTGSSGAKLAAGATSWTTLCDRNAKKNFRPLDTVTILEKLAAIPIQQWNYKWEPDSATPNIGPMAQDFKAAFYPGRDDKGITTLEFDGVALAAIQGLNQRLNEQKLEANKKDAQIQQLEQQNSALEKRLSELERKMESLAGE